MTQISYKFRLYPTAEQRRQLAIEFGTARWVWNKALDWRSRAWRDEHINLTGVDFSRELTFLKTLEPYSWLKDASSTVLTRKLRDLDTAFSNFFAGRARYPRFKKKSHTQSVRYYLDHRRVHNNYKPGEMLKLPKLGALKIKWSRTPNGTPKMVTVSQDSLSHYYVSFGVETVVSPLPQTDTMIGVDRGVKDVLVFSTGEKSGAPKFFRQYQRRLKLAQRVMSRRRKGSQRWHRARRRVANIQIKITACRLDFTHKATTKLVREAQVIALEKLNIKGLMKNRHLAKSIGDSSLYEVQRQIEYKATWYGRDVFFSDQWAPTSKACSDCGSVQNSMALHVRRWVCPHCKTEHDRDINAAKNVLTFATGGRPGSYARGGVQTPAGEVTKTPHQRTPVKREFAQLTS